MRKYFIGFFILLAAVFFAGTALASTATFTWDYPNPPDDLAGFRLYVGTVSGTYTALEEIAPELRTITITIVADSTRYYVLRAFDTSGNESGNSNEVSTTVGVDTTPPPVPGQLNISVTVNVGGN